MGTITESELGFILRLSHSYLLCFGASASAARACGSSLPVRHRLNTVTSSAHASQSLTSSSGFKDFNDIVVRLSMKAQLFLRNPLSRISWCEFHDFEYVHHHSKVTGSSAAGSLLLSYTSTLLRASSSSASCMNYLKIHLILCIDALQTHSCHPFD